nr:orcokinin [Helicoverpa armigera]
MMRSASGALAVAVAALLVCCSANPHQEQDVSGSEHNSAERFDASGHKTAAVDASDGGALVRKVREIRHSGYVPYLISRRFASPYGGYYGDGFPKRNFDEIDRSGLNTFVQKRNFDEIDLSQMPLLQSKRFSYSSGLEPLQKRNFDEIDLSQMPYLSAKRYSYPSGLNTLVQKRNNFDEIDASEMPPFKSRSGVETYLKKRTFDELDQSNIKVFPSKRFSHISSFDKKRYRAEYPIDEIDLSHFPIGSKRSQDSVM